MSEMKATHKAIRLVLQECGPLTSKDVSEFFPGSSHRNISSMLNKMRLAAVRVVYIHSYSRGDLTTRTHPRRVYALGDKPDAKPPKKQTWAECSKRYRRGAPAARACASVFDLARFI